MSGSIIERIGTWVCALGVPVILVMVAYTVPWTVTASENYGRLDERLESFQRSVERSFSDLEVKVGSIQADMGEIASRVREAEVDPMSVLARGGVHVDDTVVAGFIEGKMVLFPKDEQTGTRLVEAGYELTTITPYLTGYIIRDEHSAASGETQTPTPIAPVFRPETDGVPAQ